MRLDSLPAITRGVAERERLLQLRASVDADKLQLVVVSTYQDDAMVALVRPVVVREINARLYRLEAEPKALGIELPIAAA